jgi:hypothetical protein
MASKRGRKRKQKQLRAAERSRPPIPPKQPPPPPSSIPLSGPDDPQNPKRFWGIARKFLRQLMLVLGALGTIAGLFAIYPWLSISRGPFLDPSNPLSTMYDVTNEGLLPAVSLDADCTFWFEMTGTGVSGHASDVTTPFPNFADNLYHSGTATLPCFRSIGLGRTALPLASADMRARVSYFVWPFICSFCKRHQTFRFKGSVRGDLPMQWTFDQ